MITNVGSWLIWGMVWSVAILDRRALIATCQMQALDKKPRKGWLVQAGAGSVGRAGGWPGGVRWGQVGQVGGASGMGRDGSIGSFLL